MMAGFSWLPFVSSGEGISCDNFPFLSWVACFFSQDNTVSYGFSRLGIEQRCCRFINTKFVSDIAFTKMTNYRLAKIVKIIFVICFPRTIDH